MPLFPFVTRPVVMAETQPAGELTLKGLHRPIPAFNVCGLVSAGAEAMDQPVT